MDLSLQSELGREVSSFFPMVIADVWQMRALPPDIPVPVNAKNKMVTVPSQTRNLRAVQLLLAKPSLRARSGYLGIEIDDALEIAEQTEV